MKLLEREHGGGGYQKTKGKRKGSHLPCFIAAKYYDRLFWISSLTTSINIYANKGPGVIHMSGSTLTAVRAQGGLSLQTFPEYHTHLEVNWCGLATIPLLT